MAKIDKAELEKLIIECGGYCDRIKDKLESIHGLERSQQTISKVINGIPALRELIRDLRGKRERKPHKQVDEALFKELLTRNLANIGDMEKAFKRRGVKVSEFWIRSRIKENPEWKAIADKFRGKAKEDKAGSPILNMDNSSASPAQESESKPRFSEGNKQSGIEAVKYAVKELIGGQQIKIEIPGNALLRVSYAEDEDEYDARGVWGLFSVISDKLIAET